MSAPAYDSSSPRRLATLTTMSNRVLCQQVSMTEFLQLQLLQWGIHDLLRLLVFQFSLTSTAAGVLCDIGDIWDMVSMGDCP